LGVSLAPKRRLSVLTARLTKRRIVERLAQNNFAGVDQRANAMSWKSGASTLRFVGGG